MHMHFDLSKQNLSMWLIALVGLLSGGCDSGRLELAPPVVSPAALESRARAQLEAALTSPDAASRCHAMEALAAAGTLDAPAKLRRGLHDPSPAVRFAAAVAAGDLGEQTLRARLEQLARDPNPSVKLAAGYALERFGDERFVRWYDLVLQGADLQLCAQACMLLGKLGPTPLRAASRAKLWQVMKREDVDAAVRLEAAEALARLGDETVLKRLVVFASSPYADDRLRAIPGLKALGGPDAYAMIALLADDPQLEVRLGAIRALGSQADDTDRELARTAVNHDDPQGDPVATARVRGLALLALGAVGHREDAGRFMQAFDDDMEYVRLAAVQGALVFTQRLRSLEQPRGM